jgi:hypothetical protein
MHPPGMEREAMQFAVELMHTGKSVHAAVCNRLEIITHEDIDTGSQPWIVPFFRVRMRTDAAMVRGRQTRRGAARHRQRDPHDGQGGQVTGGCHFAAAIGLASELEGAVPSVPDWALDQHTTAGRRRGRGIEHFRHEGARLVPPPGGKDEYEDDAYRLWALKAKRRPKDDDGQGRLL